MTKLSKIEKANGSLENLILTVELFGSLVKRLDLPRMER